MHHPQIDIALARTQSPVELKPIYRRNKSIEKYSIKTIAYANQCQFIDFTCTQYPIAMKREREKNEFKLIEVQHVNHVAYAKCT